MTSRIESMRIGDYDEVVVLWKMAEGVGLNEGDDRAGIARYLERNPGLSLVARDGQGVIVGAVLCGHDGRRAYLNHLAVAASHRRQGIGSRLVAACFAKLRELGLPKCSILIYADNDAGKAFWIGQGWQARENLRLLQKLTAAK